ncbi:MAG TPA: aspartyl/asparaginyl beta-hydroxylase domain-containing protein [Aliidongia sp.]|uniref:aspartyl/asparaginyl beta-hydroxylase domain-containing protein n=1 Tax=Aliidongia sp. TaxID=1914230 RepID=UPI002DDD211B|nr:aspartyl/asparaginyl beta-hydroxylase domain-containing protein [Aliidongia sp.]HEV2674161.1 aspartyl/asparaginyl beta-hydroxylase domain-containing protein [Aliidongia sp.]
MKHFTLIADRMPIAPLLGQMEDHPELWDAYQFRKQADGTPHSGMSDIWVRYRPQNELTDHASYKVPHLADWWPAWSKLPALKPIVFDLMRCVEGTALGGIFITRIPPGGEILPHTDDGWHVETFSKFYVSLKSSPGATFWCDHDGVRESLEPKPGECWVFDNRKRHGVKNDSSEDRITLIICIRTEHFR